MELRIGIGIGRADPGRSESELASWSGPAFESAGKALGKLEIGLASRLALVTPWPEINDEFAAILTMLEAILARWTPEQHQVLIGTLLSRGQKKLAAELGISQPGLAGVTIGGP